MQNTNAHEPADEDGHGDLGPKNPGPQPDTPESGIFDILHLFLDPTPLRPDHSHDLPLPSFPLRLSVQLVEWERLGVFEVGEEFGVRLGDGGSGGIEEGFEFPMDGDLHHLRILALFQPCSDRQIERFRFEHVRVPVRVFDPDPIWSQPQ